MRISSCFIFLFMMISSFAFNTITNIKMIIIISIPLSFFHDRLH